MRIIVLEGINGAGKTTAARQIRAAVQELGFQCLCVDPAATGPIGKLLRERIVDPDFEHNPELDTVLFAGLRAEGAQHILHTIREHPSVVLVLERWSLALTAYGIADSTSPELIRELRRVLDNLFPVDVTLIFDLRGEVACSRLSSLPKKNRFELRGEEYLNLVASTYRDVGECEAGTTVIDASASRDIVGEQIQSVLISSIPEFHGLRLNGTGAEDPAQLDLGI